jgi:hypothetical protein
MSYHSRFDGAAPRFEVAPLFGFVGIWLLLHVFRKWLLLHVGMHHGASARPDGPRVINRSAHGQCAHRPNHAIPRAVRGDGGAGDGVELAPHPCRRANTLEPFPRDGCILQ